MYKGNSINSIFVPKQSLLFHADHKKHSEYEEERCFRVKEDRFAVIEASAGTGKTFSLVELVLELILEQQIPLKKILLVTFTEKATSELKIRLRSKFNNFLEAFENKDDLLREIPDGPFWEIDYEKKNLIKAALLDFESTQIFTIHGFCKRILSEFAFENRQLFEQEFCETNILFQDVFSRYIRKNILSKKTSVSRLFSLYIKQNEGNLETFKKEILTLLNKEGVIVPKLPHFSDFISDFTKCLNPLISKDQALREQNLDQHPILTVFLSTALNRVSSEKTFKNIKLLLKILADVHTGSSIDEILPSFFEIDLSSITNPKCKKKLLPGEKWLSQKEFPQAERLWMDSLNECEKFLKKNNIFRGAKKILKAWLIQNVLEEIHFELAKTKLEEGLFDFDDLLRVVEEELYSDNKKNTVLTPLTIAVREKYLCAIVDEFQDTDQRQWSIFKHLFLESAKHRLILIGDPKQSIYSFRGADVFTYLKARKKIQERTSNKPFVLKKNYRSSEKMISGLNQIFGGDLWFPENRGIVFDDVDCGNQKLELKDNNPNRDAIHLLKLTPKFTISAKKIEDLKKFQTSNMSLDILNELKPFVGENFFSKEDFLKKLNSILGFDIVNKNIPFFLNLFLNDQTKSATIRFADAISLEIKNLLRFEDSENERPIWKNGVSERTINENDICVLFRKTNEGEAIAKSLRKLGIDFVFYKQTGLFSGREAKEILVLLQAIANPTDFSRVGKLWLTRFFGVNLKEIRKIGLRYSKILYQLKEWNLLAGSRKFGKLFESILNQTKLIERELFLGGGERSVTNYLHLFEILNMHILERHLNLFELIQLLKGYLDGKEVNLGKESLLRVESERKAVQLMTMHAAKGLEFPIVFLFGGLTGSKRESIKFYYDNKEEKQIIDLLNSEIPKEHKWQEEAEQQRLLYVAMTRARGRLYLPYIGLLSSKSKRRICKINGPYSILNEELSNIIRHNIFDKKILPFSISFTEISSKNQTRNFFQKDKLNIGEWEPTYIKKNSSYLNKMNNLEGTFEKLRFEKRGFVVTSFSKLKREENKNINKYYIIKESPLFEFRNEEKLGQLRENDEIVFDISGQTPEADLDLSLNLEGTETISMQENSKNELIGGIQMGNLLHELLENLDFSSIRKSLSLEEWVANPSVYRFIESFNDSYGFPNTMVSLLAEIIWKTLRTKIKLGKNPDSPVLELANIKKDLREVDFYYPIPKIKSELDQLFYNYKNIREGWKVEKGFLRGSIDLIFEHNGKIYLLDWKSNILEDYNPEKLEEVVLEQYELQFQIYTLATCYWFKINFEEKYGERFGGVIYLFMRGMKNNYSNFDKSSTELNSGVFFKKPSWKEFLDYEKKLCNMDY